MAPHSTSLTGAGHISRLRAAAVGAVAALSLLALASDQALVPQRIVSVIPATTEILFAVGAGAQVIGVGSYDRHPAEVNRLPRVGGLVDPDIETIITLRPDLVVAYATQRDLLAQLARARIPVFQYEHGSLSDIIDTVRALGARTGHAAQGQRVAARMEADLAAIRERVRDRPRPRTILVFAREPNSLRNLFASGGFGFQHDMLEIAGGANVFAEINRRAVQANTEAILAAAPDVVLEVSDGSELLDADIAREIDVWSTLPGLPAVRGGRVHFLVGSDLVVPGPRITDATARLARALHPDAFEQE